jgi:hypothetical protein
MRNWRTNQTRTMARPLWILGLNLVVLGLARITLLLLNRSHFGELAVVEIGSSLFRGLLFDVSIVAPRADAHAPVPLERKSVLEVYLEPY